MKCIETWRASDWFYQPGHATGPLFVEALKVIQSKMQFANNKHQIQYLFPRQAGSTNPPASALSAVFPTVNLTSLTDSICINLFGQLNTDTSDTSTAAANSVSPNPAADENNE